ncbi:DnaJ-class molecular chaperone [Streptosporangium becharense]|uniref:DnaJ-class molecular chaperone n=1 Tax=Streptosporangium becharense TaxID=1816182 RepID=A0A7W9MFL7_9ACTN|nr:DnaJ-class molecular chaperone [Streptosporangium becharense]MBB5818935.1 DnaJ-class molecular chaperone [Streptosporangium becharense]
MSKPVPNCGHCAGSGKITYDRPRRQEDGSVIWVKSTENCHVCGGSGKCR